MRSLDASVEIRAEPAAVFDLIHDYGRRLEWDPFLREARLLGDAPRAALGVRALCVARLTSGGLGMETVYVSFERPHVAAVRMTRGPFILGSFAATLRQAAVAPGLTRVTYRFNASSRPSWLRPVLDPLVGAFFLREVRRRLRALKRFLEEPRG